MRIRNKGRLQTGVEAGVALVTASVLVSGLVACAPQGSQSERLRAKPVTPKERTDLQIQQAFGRDYQPLSEANLALSKSIVGLSLEVFPSREQAVSASPWQPGLSDRRSRPQAGPVVTQTSDGRIRLRAQQADSSPGPMATPGQPRFPSRIADSAEADRLEAFFRVLIVVQGANQPLVAVGQPTAEMSSFEVLNADQFNRNISVEGQCTGDRCESFALVLKDRPAGADASSPPAATFAALFKRTQGSRFAFTSNWVAPRVAGENGTAASRPEARVAMRQVPAIKASAPSEDLPPLTLDEVSRSASPSPTPAPSATPTVDLGTAPSATPPAARPVEPTPAAEPASTPAEPAPRAAAPTVEEP